MHCLAHFKGHYHGQCIYMLTHAWKLSCAQCCCENTTACLISLLRAGKMLQCGIKSSCWLTLYVYIYIYAYICIYIYNIMIYQCAAYAMAATCAGSWASRDGCAESHPMVLPTCLLSNMFNGQRLWLCDSSAAWNDHFPTTALYGCSIWSSSTLTYTIKGWWNMIGRHQSLVVSLAQMSCPKVWILFWHDVLFECTIINTIPSIPCLCPLRSS